MARTRTFQSLIRVWYLVAARAISAADRFRRHIKDSSWLSFEHSHFVRRKWLRNCKPGSLLFVASAMFTSIICHWIGASSLPIKSLLAPEVPFV